MSAEEHALRLQREARMERKFWHRFSVAKTVFIVLTFGLMLVAVGRFLSLVR
jgi:hypothetical protein